MLKLKGITKRFGTLFAVKNLSFDVNECEFVVLFGPAGAGKTTTLRLIAGIAKENYGDILFNGQSLNRVPPEKRNFSMVFENYALYSHLTVFENLAFPLRARRISEEKVTQLVIQMGALLHIESMLDRKPGHLSGGQRQRVALGRCLIRDAHLYLLDEPISHLDARLRIQMRAELKNICIEKQSTVIHVTHDYREAMALADKVIVLNQGTIMQEGTPENVFLYPANEFVASFIGNPPMSFIEVDRASENGQIGYRITGSDIFIPSNNQHNLHSIENRKIKLGLRATKTSIAREKDDFHNTLAEIYIVESQGHRNLTTVKIGEQLSQVVTSPEEVWEVGDCAWIALHSDNLHVFADGEAVIHPN
jgi:multiple sugar transport system ATP-binding protein